MDKVGRDAEQSAQVVAQPSAVAVKLLEVATKSQIQEGIVGRASVAVLVAPPGLQYTPKAS